MRARSMSTAAYAVALVLFILSAAGFKLGDLSAGDLLALGLAAFALGHLLP